MTTATKEQIRSLCGKFQALYDQHQADLPGYVDTPHDLAHAFLGLEETKSNLLGCPHRLPIYKSDIVPVLDQVYLTEGLYLSILKAIGYTALSTKQGKKPAYKHLKAWLGQDNVLGDIARDTQRAIEDGVVKRSVTFGQIHDRMSREDPCENLAILAHYTLGWDYCDIPKEDSENLLVQI